MLGLLLWAPKLFIVCWFDHGYLFLKFNLQHFVGSQIWILYDTIFWYFVGMLWVKVFLYGWNQWHISIMRRIRQHYFLEYFDVFWCIRYGIYTVYRPNTEIWKASPYHDTWNLLDLESVWSVIHHILNVVIFSHRIENPFYQIKLL